MRRFRIHIQILLFVSSYVPLFIIMGFQFWNIGPVRSYPIPHTGLQPRLSHITIGVVLGSIVITGLLYIILNIHADRGPNQRLVKNYQKRNELLSSYLIAYVFVFAGLNFTQTLDMIIFGLFFVMLGVLQIQSGHLHVNPMLGLKGYEVYEVTTSGETVLIISDAPLEEKLIPLQSDNIDKEDKKIDVVPLDNSTYLAT